MSESKICQNCKAAFTIEPADFRFYERMQVPPPTWCPECRLQRRWAWRNERGLYKRSCDMCKKEIIAMYPADVPFPVYCRDCWYSDQWDPLAYGRDYDLQKPFFVQFKELQEAVPRIALQVSESVNCDYANQIANCKNCYLVWSGSENEDSMFSYRLHKSRRIADSFMILRSENTYQAMDCTDSADVLFSHNCVGGVDLAFCYDIRNSQNCAMSANLRRASHVFRNRQMDKNEYDSERNAMDTGSYRKLREYEREFAEVKRKAIHKFADITQSVNSTGHSISSSKNARNCFNTDKIEDCAYCILLNDTKDAMDVNNGCCVAERVYETSTMGVKASDIKFCVDAWPEVTNATYSDSCRNGARDVFGCISVRKRQYCILNKQYTRDGYEALVPKIIEHMNKMPYTDRQGRVYKYGEFFPPELSPFPYGDTTAQDYFPLSDEEVQARGFRWLPAVRSEHKPDIGAEDLPDHIKDVSDSILEKVVGCAHQGKCSHRCVGAFKIVPEELALYRRMNLPLPRECPNCRHYGRIEKRNPLRLWERQCMCAMEKHGHAGPCANKFQTSYAPDRPETVYCEACYNAEVV
ncbi:MAG: hypothetical protein UY99_C0005G0022 [Parcubacteria group bacterium GW2011_GWA1_59_11]|nr:MAG: hypothetical protein UY99_C0005G0022 [Parcubacteria group bacterium GW2011_GWA1_59_11]